MKENVEPGTKNPQVENIFRSVLKINILAIIFKYTMHIITAIILNDKI